MLNSLECQKGVKKFKTKINKKAEYEFKKPGYISLSMYST